MSNGIIIFNLLEFWISTDMASILFAKIRHQLAMPLTFYQVEQALHRAMIVLGNVLLIHEHTYNIHIHIILVITYKRLIRLFVKKLQN